MVKPFRRQRDDYDYEPRVVRFEFLRNLVALVIALGAVALAGSFLPRFFESDGEETPTATTIPEVEEDVVVSLSGRFQPTTLSADHTWIGSLGETVPAPSFFIDRRVVLGNPEDGSLARSIVIDVGAFSSPPPQQFDTAQVPFDIVESDTAQILVAVDDDPSDEHLVVNLPGGRQLWVTGTGVTVDELLRVVDSVSLFEPPDIGDAAADSQLVQISVGNRLDLDVLSDVLVDEKELSVIVDNFVVPGRSEFSVAVRHYADWTDFDPIAIVAASPTATLTRVRDSDAVIDRTLIWRERSDLVIEIDGQGYTQAELERIAGGLRELTDDELNRRRPPTEEVTVSFDPVPGPEPAFDVSNLGTPVELLPNVQGDLPFAEGQLIGPVVAVGRLEGTDIDVYTWQRGDGEFAECIAVTGTGVGATFCLTDEDVDLVTGPRRAGAAWITEGPNAGGRVHVYRVSGRAAVVQASVDGDGRRQRPIEGIAVFVSAGSSDISVRGYAADGSQLG